MLSVKSSVVFGSWGVAKRKIKAEDLQESALISRIYMVFHEKSSQIVAFVHMLITNSTLSDVFSIKRFLK